MLTKRTRHKVDISMDEESAQIPVKRLLTAHHAARSGGGGGGGGTFVAGSGTCGPESSRSSVCKGILSRIVAPVGGEFGEPTIDDRDMPIEWMFVLIGTRSMLLQQR